MTTSQSLEERVRTAVLDELGPPDEEVVASLELAEAIVHAVVEAVGAEASLTVPVADGEEGETVEVTMKLERGRSGGLFVRLDCTDGYRLVGDAPGDYYVEVAR